MSLRLLQSLADKKGWGYSLKERIRDMTDGAVDPSTAALYKGLGELLENRLVERLPEKVLARNGKYRVYYQITESGRARLRREFDKAHRALEKAYPSWLWT